MSKLTKTGKLRAPRKKTSEAKLPVVEQPKADNLAGLDAREWMRLIAAKGGRTMTQKRRDALAENLRKANVGCAKYWAKLRAEGGPLGVQARKGKRLHPHKHPQ